MCVSQLSLAEPDSLLNLACRQRRAWDLEMVLRFQSQKSLSLSLDTQVLRHKLRETSLSPSLSQLGGLAELWSFPHDRRAGQDLQPWLQGHLEES